MSQLRTAIDALPDALKAEIDQLERDGYVVHKLWMNGVELRKGRPVGDGKFALALVLLFVCPALPFVARSSIANLFGYRHRIFLDLDGAIHFV
jgi:hypothetical protein